jgi:outer membrane protein OmpA-like peptidoglycan-associated protein
VNFQDLKIATLAILILFILPLPTLSQQLLVNGSFEEPNVCSEYQIKCAPEGWISSSDGFPNYFTDAKRAFDGDHFLAIEVGNRDKPFQRTFVRSRLLCGLRKGHKYLLEFQIRSRHPVLDSIGVIFTSFDFLFGQKRLQNLVPSLFVQPAKGSFSRDSSWQRVLMEYTAKGDESFIAIANFARKGLSGPTGIQMENHFFVFIDKISLTPMDRHEGLCADWQKNQQEIYAQDERHEWLRRDIREQKDNPPVVVIPTTRYVQVDTLVIPDVFFATAKADLKPTSKRMLDSVCRKLATRKIDSIVVEGHTDNTGTAAFNQQLSLDRAVAVETALWLRLPTPLVSYTRAWADTKPIATNDTAEGRQRNRRVEIYVYTKN